MKSASIALAAGIAVASAVTVEERRDPLLTWSATPKKSAYPMDYAVPTFGEDHDIIETKKSWAAQEKAHGHFWDVNKPKPEDPPRDYYVPNFGTDSEITASLKNLGDQEAKHGTWNMPKDSFAQVFGNIGNMPEEHEHVQLESDPICSSAGCTQYKHKKKELGYKINYPVPNFGVDNDILDSKASLDLAEKQQGYKLDLPNPKWKKPKVVDWAWDYPLDEDAISSLKNLEDSEKELNHKWVIA